MADTSTMDAPAEHSNHTRLNLMEAAMPTRQPEYFEIKDFSFGVENPTAGDTFDFKLTSDPTAPESGQVWDWNKKVMDGHIDGTIDGLVVDPNNPNVGDPVTFTYTVSSPTGTDTDGTLVDNSADPSNEIVVTKVCDIAST